MRMILVAAMFVAFSVFGADDIDAGTELGTAKAATLLKALDADDADKISAAFNDVGRWIRSTSDMSEAGHYEVLCYAAVMAFMADFKPTDEQIASLKRWLDKNPKNEGIAAILAAAKKAEKQHTSANE